MEKSIAYQLFHVPGVDTDWDRPDRDGHVLDADPDPEPANGSQGFTLVLFFQYLPIFRLKPKSISKS